MQTFRQLFEDKACDDAFRNLYEQECHVCSYTVRIFEKIEKLGMDLKTLAAELNMDLLALLDFKDAEYCDPRLAIRLCEYLDLNPPTSCARLS